MEAKIDVIQYLEEVLEAFDDSPPDCDYQYGYQDAFLEMYDFFNEG